MCVCADAEGPFRSGRSRLVGGNDSFCQITALSVWLLSSQELNAAVNEFIGGSQ